MRTLNLQLVGSTPLLLHQISRHQFREQIAASKGSVMTQEEEAHEVMSKDEKGNPVVPVPWIWDSLRVACSRVKVEQGKQLSFSNFHSLVKLPQGLLSLRDTDNHTPTWEVYSSLQHADPRSKKSVTVIAPKFKDWMLVVPLELPADHLLINNALENRVLIHRVFSEAGKVGIGLFHPPKKHFGQFRVEIL